jgi:hypothetical protein
VRAGLVALLLALAVAPAAQADAWREWSGTGGDDAGRAVVSHGEAIWTGYLYDDYGANVDGFRSMSPDLFIGLLSPHVYADDPEHPVGFAPSGNVGRFRHSGDYGYPPAEATDPAADPFGDTAPYDNVADVAETRVAIAGSDAYFRFALTDLKKDSTVIGLAIDTTAGAGGGAWPFGAGLSSADWDRFLTVWGSGGALTTPAGERTPVAVRADLDANVIEARVPLAQLAGERWRLVGGAGRWDAAAQAWATAAPTTTQTTSPGAAPGGPNVYELLFHQGEPNSLWNETRQADDLAAGTVDAHGWTVDLGDLRSGASSPRPCRPGAHEESFTTGSPPDEGLTVLPTQNGGTANFHNVDYVYHWPLQPLAVMLPRSACDRDAPAPSLDFFFHPANVNHNAWLVGMEGDAARVTYVDDPPLGYDHVTELTERYDRITAAGLARTEGWNYGDAPGEERADWDAFEAVTARHRYARDHVRVVGMSGRLGPAVFAETWPDRVSSIYTVSAHTADSPRLANLRNTPWVFMHGTSHLELQSDLPGYDVQEAHLDQLGYQYLRMIWNGRGHDFGLVNRGYGLVEPWTRAGRIVPARITYQIDPKAPPGLPLFSGVDWIGADAALADPKKPGRIDLLDRSRAARLPKRETRFKCTFTNAATTDQVAYQGLAYELPAVLDTRMPDVVDAGWSRDSCDYTVKELPAMPPARAISGTLENLANVTVDLRRTGLDPARNLDVSGIASATPVRLRLVAGRAARTVTVPGARCVPSLLLRFRLARRARSAEVRVNGRVRARTHRRTLVLRRPARRSFTVTLTQRLAGGKVLRSRRAYAGCAVRRVR